MEKIYYAKSDTMETIKQHTDKLLNNLELLKKSYEKNILEVKNINIERIFYLLEIICKYHDTGKVYTPFQNIILEKLHKPLIKTEFKYNVKHEQLSPAFVPIENFNLSKDEKKLIYQSIYYHHEREFSEIDIELFFKILERDIKPQIKDIEKNLDLEISKDLSPIYLKYVKNRIIEGDELYNEYCLLKGLLHRLDHSSSALLDVEDNTITGVSEYTEKYLVNKGFELNELQIYAKNNQNKNLLIVGSTGLGKTEAALLWSDKEKCFFTLPIRISINAIYDRINDNINYKHVGLLHSSARDYLENKQALANQEYIYEQTKNLYSKIITCTIDQIFPFVFKYKGYEKIYSTLAYSKIIIDEIQAYSPELVAILLKGIQMINNIGGKFMIMTATLPKIYKDELEKMNVTFEYKEFIKPIERHNIELIDLDIIDELYKIKECAENKKVLVIVNTVNRAIELFEELTDCANVNLLHSRFIAEDRTKKENQIKEFSNIKKECGIWITTQIVEASLDIDFDCLYTEMSTLDSLFQRLGRCYRNRLYSSEKSNIHIYIKNCSGIGSKSVYDLDIHEKSIELLKAYNNRILQETDKIKLVEKLYSREMLEGTKFLEKFEAGIKILNNLIDYDVNKKEAVNLLRNIDNVSVIPKIIYESNIEIFEKYVKTSVQEEKNELMKYIRKLTTSISMFQTQKLKNKLIKIPYMEDFNILIIDMEYDDRKGLLLSENAEDDFDNRTF